MGHDTVEIMGLEFDVLTEAGAVGRIRAEIAAGRGGWVATPNLDQLRRLHADPELRSLIQGASIVVADGMPLIWAAAIQGTPLPERVAGSDLVWSIAELARDLDVGIDLVGGHPESVAPRAAAQLCERFPGLRIENVQSPPFGFERDPEARAALRRRIAESEAGIAYVGLGFPKQDRLIAELREASPRKWFLGCGISLSFIAGDVNRAPPLLRRAGLEWLYRLSQEPRRLAGRYLVDDLPFSFRLFGHAVRRRLGHRPRRGEAEDAGN